MTLGADAFASDVRTQFLGAWRLCSDFSSAAAPLVVSALSLVAPVLPQPWRWVPRLARHRLAGALAPGVRSDARPELRYA